MSDSVSVVIGCEAVAGVARLPVVPDADGECEYALADAGPDAGEGAAAVAFERELAFGGVDDRFDPLADTAEGAEARRFVAAVGPQQAGRERAGDLLELLAGEAFVGDDELVTAERAASAHPLEQRRRHLAFGLVGRGETEAVRHPVRRADEVEAETPEVAGVCGAVAVGGMASELRALDRLPRLRAGNRCRVEQPQPVAERGRAAGEDADELTDLRGKRPNPLVVAGLLGDVGKQVTEPAAGEAQETALGRAVEEDLRDSQTDDLGVCDPRLAPRPAPLGQEIISEHIKCDEKSVEVGRHAASLVGVASATPDFDASTEDHSPAVAVNSESLI